MTEIKTSDVLNRAADYLQAAGWRQDDYGEDGGPRCLIGAIRSAAGIEADMLVKDRTDPVADHLGINRHYIHVWNDEDERTATEVIEVLRATALVEAARETDDRSLAAIKHAAGLFGVTV